ncbi:hypothetical protein [Haloferax sp. DFSO52]|uniref:hypothetical protein n=1 Tax=Haloferax sp. DFSO52 TaxID=3388505 RepID=UPI003A87F3F8
MQRLVFVAIVCLTVTAGCLGGGKPPVTAAGSPATVDGDTLDSAGFEQVAASDETHCSSSRE